LVTVTVDREQVTFARLVAERAGDAVEIDRAVDVGGAAR